MDGIRFSPFQYSAAAESYLGGSASLQGRGPAQSPAGAVDETAAFGSTSKIGKVKDCKT